jgi:hypothetical protein
MHLLSESTSKGKQDYSMTMTPKERKRIKRLLYENSLQYENSVALEIEKNCP